MPRAGELDDEVADRILPTKAIAALEFRVDHRPGISLGRLPRQPHALGRPEAEQLVAASRHLEAQLLVVLEPRLEFLFALLEGVHGLSRIRWRCLLAVTISQPP